MSSNRRDFLRLSLATTAFLTALEGTRGHAQTKAAADAKPPKKLRMLVFGGTGFIGPDLVRYALSRGHEVTLFNRGKTNTHLFPDLEKIVGNRDPSKDEGLKGIEGKTWDVVFDDNGYFPRHVKASADMLAKAGVDHYVYVSSVSAYASFAVDGQDEDAPAAKLDDPTVETMGDQGQYYGGLKVLCEDAAKAAFPKGCTVVRPGYIVGPGDPTDRFTYWPVRISRGGDALVPGTTEDPIQVIDVRDLAEWMVLLAEARTLGVFNACGPEKKLSWGTVIDACTKACEKPAKVHWASVEELMGEKAPGLPIWAPPQGEERGVHTASNARAIAAGLTFRPIQMTVSDTLAWFKEQPPERQKDCEAGSKRGSCFASPITAAEEERVLKALGRI